MSDNQFLNNFIMEYRYPYIFDKKKKFNCPYCGGVKKWRRYIDSNTGDYTPEEYGICDRSESCGAHYKPPYDNRENQNLVIKKEPKRSKIYIPKDVCRKTMIGYRNSCFAKGLINSNLFSYGMIDKTLRAYGIGRFDGFGKYKNSTSIPYIDEKGNIHTVQCKTFGKDLHTKNTNWIHSLFNLDKYKEKKYSWLDNYINNNTGFMTCLFGAHLLPKYPNNPIGLVESPKSAIICTLYYGLPNENDDDKIIWLATGNKGSLTYNRLKCLDGREIDIYADLSENRETQRDWKKKMIEISEKLKNIDYEFIDSIYKQSTLEEQKKGLDIADFLLRDLKEKFHKKKDKENLSNSISEKYRKAIKMNCKRLVRRSTAYNENNYETIFKARNVIIKGKEYKILDKVRKEVKRDYPIYDSKIKKLESYFNQCNLPNSLKLDKGIFISDLKNMINSHISYIKNNIENNTHKPYLSRLEAIRIKLESI